MLIFVVRHDVFWIGVETFLNRLKSSRTHNSIAVSEPIKDRIRCLVRWSLRPAVLDSCLNFLAQARAVIWPAP